MIEPVQLDEKYLFEYKQISLPPGIKKLLKAILNRAVSDLRRGHDSDLQDWFDSSEYKKITSFRNICSVLGLDPDLARRWAMSNPRHTGKYTSLKH